MTVIRPLSKRSLFVTAFVALFASTSFLTTASASFASLYLRQAVYFEMFSLCLPVPELDKHWVVATAATVDHHRLPTLSPMLFRSMQETKCLADERSRSEAVLFDVDSLVGTPFSPTDFGGF